MIRKAGIEDIPAIRKMADVAFRRTYASILSPEWKVKGTSLTMVVK